MMQKSQSVIENIPQLIGMAYSLANPFDNTNTLDVINQTTPPSIMENLKKIINANEYVNACVSNKTKDYNSLSYLINRDLSQSDCIKLGTGSEKVLIDIILKNNQNLENI